MDVYFLKRRTQKNKNKFWVLSLGRHLVEYLSWDSENWEAYMYNVHGLYCDQNISVGKIDVCVEVWVVQL